MTDGAAVVNAYTSAVALYDADTYRLAGMHEAEFYLTAAVRVDTSAAERSVATFDDTVLQVGVGDHVYASAVSRVVARRGIARGGVTRRDDAAVEGSGVFVGFVVVADLIGSSEPDDVE